MRKHESARVTYQRAIFLGALVAGTSVVAFANLGIQSRLNTNALGYAQNHWSIGSIGRSNVGWYAPANTIISTTYVTNKSLAGFVTGILNVFPYQIDPSTSLRLGLYVNGQLEASQYYTLNDTRIHAATPVLSLSSQQEEFSNSSVSLLGFTVSILPLTSSLASGTTVTVAVLVDHPIWVQVDTEGGIHSYEMAAPSQQLPAFLAPATGLVAPFVLSVELESNA